MKPQSVTLSLLLASFAAAQAPQVAVSIGIRETGFAGQPFTTIGDNGATTGGIEWINLDGQMLTLDGTWQFFSFNLANDPVTAFAGASANGVIEGGWGTLEHIRILNSQGYTGPISLWIDDVSNTITPTGGSPTTTVFGTFDPYANGAEVMFQEPSFSGSTSGNILAGSTSGVDNFVASRTPSCRCDFSFLDATPTRWVRLTTFNTISQRNPLVRFDQSSTIGFWLRGGVRQPDLGSQGPGAAIAEMVGTGLNLGQTSTYYAGNIASGNPGAFLLSLPNNPDLAIFGGNLVSFGGLLAAVSVSADANGRLVLPITGSPALVDVVIQSVFFDVGQPQLLTFTNAVMAQFGR